jgi:hypothetical protein
MCLHLSSPQVMVLERGRWEKGCPGAEEGLTQPGMGGVSLQRPRLLPWASLCFLINCASLGV